MKAILCNLWFALAIAAGILTGLWSRPETKASAAIITPAPAIRIAEASKTPRTTTPEIARLSLAEMDNEVADVKAIDRKYALSAFFGGNRLRQAAAEEAARRLSKGNYDSYRNLDSTYQQASTEEEKREIYQQLSRERVFALLYLYEVAKDENLLIRPSDTRGETSTPQGTNGTTK